MVEILFLLLPIAFFSGWRAAHRHFKRRQEDQCRLSDRFVKGVNFLLSEEPDKALEVFLNYPDIDEYTAETYQLLGNLFRNRGEVDRALRVHQNLIARANLNPDQKQKAMFSLGEDFLAAGMLDRAEGVFQELQQSTRASNNTAGIASVCSALRTIYEQTQDWEKAIEATRCIEKYTTRDDVTRQGIQHKNLIAHYYCELADAALHEGNLHQVDKLMKEALKANKSSTRLLTLKGDIAFHQKQNAQATKLYLDAIGQDSRLLGMLFEKLRESARSAGKVDKLQSSLLAFYRKKPDKSLFEAIIMLADEFGGNPSVDELIQSELSDSKLTISAIQKATGLMLDQKVGLPAETELTLVNRALGNYLQGVPRFGCLHCGYKLHDYLWRCPACQHWDTIDHA